jgi:hypothetical protein
MHRQGQGQRTLRVRCEGFHRHHALGGQFVLHARTLPGNPYDGHTLGSVIEAAERLTGLVLLALLQTFAIRPAVKPVF